MRVTEKQKEYLKEVKYGAHRWNIKCGATRSGKTYIDYIVIPIRILERKNKEGLAVILGNTRETIRRNIIRPLQSIYTTEFISDIRTGDNTCDIFGERVYCIGADKITQSDKLRGSSIKYCYGDEIVTWNPEVFEMLKSRLDKPYSVFDGSCNPDNPNHWFKKFLDSDADIYQQHYSIDDNTFLSPEFIDNLKREYRGSDVLYNRYIKGMWCLADGLCYPRFADKPKRFEITKDQISLLDTVCVGVDFGGNGSDHAFVCSGITHNGGLVALKSRSIKATHTDAEDLIRELTEFLTECSLDYEIDGVYCDSAEQTLINTIRNRCNYPIYNSIKNPIIDRIRCESILIGGGRFFYVKDQNDDLVNGLCNAVWDSKAQKDTRLDNGTSNIDILDAFEYSYEFNMYRLVE